MTPSRGPIQPHHAGARSRVIQGFFPSGRPGIVQASPAAPVRPPVPAPVQAHPGSPPAPTLPGRPANGALQPSLRPGQPPRPILPNKVQPGAVQPATPLRAQMPQPILPKQAAPSAVQPHAGDAFPLPANFTLKPHGSGQPLPEPIQKKMEAFFNTSFADVRVHVGNEAPSIGALAFTHGTDLYFAPGQYNPQSTHGQQLLGHELTHVVQQRAGRVRNPLGAGVAVVQDPAMEAEAERMGLRAATTLAPVQAKMETNSAPVVLLTSSSSSAHLGALQKRTATGAGVAPARLSSVPNSTGSRGAIFAATLMQLAEKTKEKATKPPKKPPHLTKGGKMKQSTLNWIESCPSGTTAKEINSIWETIKNFLDKYATDDTDLLPPGSTAPTHAHGRPKRLDLQALEQEHYNFFHPFVDALAPLLLGDRGGHGNEEGKLPIYAVGQHYQEFSYFKGGGRLVRDNTSGRDYISMHYSKFYRIS